jgi:AraC-like DNA-binding protein
LTFLIGGAITERIGRRESERALGAVAFIPAGVTHALTIGPRGATTLVIEAANTSVQGQLGGPVSFSIDGWSVLRVLRTMLMGDANALDEISYDLLLEGDKRVESSEPLWLRKVKDRARDAATPLPPIELLAQDYGISAAHLARAYKQSYGATIFEAHRAARLRAAVHALLSDRESPAEIAARYGFSDQSHMNRWMRRELGVSPKRLRESLNQPSYQ